MEVNLEKFTARTSESGYLEIRLQTKEMRENPTGYWKDGPTSIYISREELRDFLNCLNGKAKYHPWFDDLSYQIRAYPAEMQIVHKENSFYEEYTVRFPWKLWPDFQAMIERQIKHPATRELILSEEKLEFYTATCASKAIWNFHDRTNGRWENFKWIEWTDKYIWKSLVTWTKTYPDLQEYIDSLERIARNYSVFGEVVEIELSFDNWYPAKDYSQPDSFYFNIHIGEARIMNGGIIAHKDERDNSVRYSMHT